jgi:hypothetical protein
MRTERAMRIQVVSRSGKEVVKGGVEVPEEVKNLFWIPPPSPMSSHVLLCLF